MTTYLIEYFGYILWIVLFSVGLYFFINRKNESKLYKPFHLFLIVFTLYFYWIPQGLDITDEGYVLTKSWFMLHGSWHQLVDLIWGSTLINGLWLTIAGTPSLLWARIGYVLIISLTITFSYKTLIVYFDKRYSFLIVAIIGMIAFIGSPQTMSYQNLPVLAIVISIFIFIKAIQKQSYFDFFWSGLFISFSVLLRFPNIILVSFPFVYYVIKILYSDTEREILKKELINSYIGILAGLFLGFIILFISGSIRDFINNSFSFLSAGNTHSFEYLLRLYQNDLWQLFSRAIYIILALFGISLIAARDARHLFQFILFLFSAYFAYFTLTFYGNSQNWIFLILSFGITSLIIYFVLKKSSDNKFEIIFFGLLLYFISFVGSDNGITMLFTSGALILPLSVFILLLKDSYFFYNKHKYSFNLSFYSFLLFVAIIFVTHKPYDVYRERPRKELNTTFIAKELKSIKSNKSRVGVTDSLLSFVNQSVKGNESIFVVGPSPLFYYLLNKKPLITDIWTCPPKEFEKLLLSSSSIDYFLITKNDPRGPSWPNSDIFPSLDIDIEAFKYYTKYIQKNLYEKIYENKMFSLYAAPQILYDLKNCMLLHENNCNEFVSGIIEGWNRHRLNSLFSESTEKFHSPPGAQKIEFNSQDDETGLTKELLEENKIYYIEAWIFAEQKIEIVIQAGGGDSIIKQIIVPNKWTKVFAYIKATGKTLYFYTGSKPNMNTVFYIDDIKVLKII